MLSRLSIVAFVGREGHATRRTSFLINLRFSPIAKETIQLL
jgi:hypothetical protein